MSDEMIAQDIQRQENITFYKHNRYMPVFDHVHTFFEMIYGIEGQCINRIDGRKLVLHEGDICIVAPFTTHSIEVFDESIVVNIIVTRSSFENFFHTLLCHSNVLSNFFSDSIYLYQQNNYIYVPVGPDEFMKEHILELAQQEFGNYPYADLRKSAILMDFFAILLQKYENQIQLSKEEQRDSQVVEII